jgi:hypothetical protein
VFSAVPQGRIIMKKALFLFGVLLILVAACPPGEKTIHGTIHFIAVEGGFYGIQGDDGKRYDPVNLPARFRQEGLRVKFSGKVLKEGVSVHMWGELIELESISREE